MKAVTLFVNFIHGSGGTDVIVRVQTALGDDVEWFDIARFDFTTLTRAKTANVLGWSGALAGDIPSPLSEESVYDTLGDRLRCVVTSRGTYASTSLNVRAAIR